MEINPLLTATAISALAVAALWAWDLKRMWHRLKKYQPIIQIATVLTFVVMIGLNLVIFGATSQVWDRGIGRILTTFVLGAEVVAAIAWYVVTTKPRR